MILCKKRKQKPWTIWMFTVKVCSKCQFRMFAIFICLKASMISLSSHSPMRIPLSLFQNKVRWKWVFINLFSRHPASSLELNNFHFFFFQHKSHYRPNSTSSSCCFQQSVWVWKSPSPFPSYLFFYDRKSF